MNYIRHFLLLSGIALSSHNTAEFILLDEALVSRAVIVIVSNLDGRTESILEPAK